MEITPPRRGYYYLACPHSHPSAEVRHLRYEAAVRCQAKLVSAGMSIFNPIVMSHEVDIHAREIGQEITHDMWLRFDYPFLFQSRGIFVLSLTGWEKSNGIAWELNVAAELSLPIIHIPGDEYMKHWPREVLTSHFGCDIVNTENNERTE